MKGTRLISSVLASDLSALNYDLINTIHFISVFSFLVFANLSMNIKAHILFLNKLTFYALGGRLCRAVRMVFRWIHTGDR